MDETSGATTRASEDEIEFGSYDDLESQSTPQPEDVEFDVGGKDDNSESQDTRGNFQNETNIFEDAMKNVPIMKNFHSGFPQLDCLADLNNMLDKCGVVVAKNTRLFDGIV